MRVQRNTLKPSPSLAHSLSASLPLAPLRSRPEQRRNSIFKLFHSFNAMSFPERPIRTPSKSGITEALLSLSRPPPSSSGNSLPYPGQILSPLNQSDLTSETANVVLSCPSNSHHSVHAVDAAASNPDQSLLMSDQSLAQSLAILACKLGSFSDQPRQQNAIKSRVPDPFDGSDPAKLDNFLFQSTMYIAAHSANFTNNESCVTFMLSY